MRKLVLPCAAAVGAVLCAVAPAARAANFVTNPAATQTVAYGAKTVSTILKMATGATANPFVIQTSARASVFSVTPSGTVTAAGGITAAAGKFTVAAGSGNTATGGTLHVTGATTLTGALTANHSATINAVTDTQALVVQGIGPSQTAAIFQVKNSGQALFAIAASGDLSITSGGTTQFTVSASDGSFSAAEGSLTVNYDGDLSTSGNMDVHGVQTFSSSPNTFDFVGQNANDVLQYGADLIDSKILVATSADGVHGFVTPSASAVYDRLVNTGDAAYANETFSFLVVNEDSSHTVFLSGGTGVTVVPNVIQPEGSRVFYCRFTNADSSFSALMSCY